MLSSHRSVLIVAAHPDDEVLGCGGTIAAYSDLHIPVHILIVAEGATSRQQHRNRSQASSELLSLKTAAENSSVLLNAASLELLDLPDNRLDSIDRLELVKLIETRIQHLKPDVVYVHHSGDLNIDHRRVHEAVITACRPTPSQPVRALFSYEVASSTDWQSPASAIPFQPNYYVNIAKHLPIKIQALEAYSAEMRQWPHSRSVQALEHLARWRGAQVGYEAAEAFCLLRHLT